MIKSGLFLSALILGVVWQTFGQRQCPRLQRPWNGGYDGICNRNVGAQCAFQCREPYILVGSKVRVCRSDGTWSGTTTACELDTCANCGNNGNSNCVNIYDPDYGYTDGQCTPGIVGQTCMIRCNRGFSIEGESRLTCLHGGQWSSRPGVCRRTSAAMCEEISIHNGYSTCSQDGGLTVCRVICHDGYMIVGPSVITCTSSGHWNDQVPSCRRSGVEVTNVCPTLIDPPGGRLAGSCAAASTGDTCQLICLSGYRPSDTRVLVCQTNGRWSDTLPRCVGDSRGCPAITVSQGRASDNCGQAQVGHICTITCHDGYTLNGGSGTLVCQANGEWSGSIPTCTAITCPALLHPVSGGASGTCSPGQVGQTCNFYCDPGYQLVGHSRLTCGNDGRWSGTPPYCTGATCPNLDTPANGGRSGECIQAIVGQSCSFSCQAGYTLNGQSTLYCQAGGVWSSTAPSCIRVTCPNLNQPANGLTSGYCSGAAVGQSCVFSCQPGFTLNGNPTLYCQDGGRWSSGSPSCIRSTPTSCPSLGAPSDGYMLGTCAPGRVGENCLFGCDEGFVLRGQRTITCTSSGQWSDKPPHCEKSDGGGGGGGGNCPVLTPPPNGEFIECDNSPGGQCTVVCEKGYVRSGTRTRTCLGQGTWTGYAPTCTRTVGYTTTYKYKVVPLWTLVFG